MNQKSKMRDMIILLPGILGSVLQKDGRDLWNIIDTTLHTKKEKQFLIKTLHLHKYLRKQRDEYYLDRAIC